MAKKKAVKRSTKSKKSHGELFDKHNNLIWLLPIFFIVAVIAVMAINNMVNKQYVDEVVVVEEEVMLEDGTLELTDTEDSMMMEEELQ